MGNIMDFPLLRLGSARDFPWLEFLVWFAAFWLATCFGAVFIRKRLPLPENVRGDFDLILGTTLTLLGLLVGFSFSMAMNRYDLRKGYEALETNTIGTEYIRTELLPDADGAKLRELMKKYVELRIAFYETGDARELRRIKERTAQLQAEMWAAVRASAKAQPSPIVALVVSGMNEVLDAQAIAQAAFWNRIPLAAWVLLTAVSAWGCMLMGYRAQHLRPGGALLVALPLLLSISLALISDMDAPRSGLVRLVPDNLIDFSQSLRAP